jgi:hypothetical protein
MSLRGIFDCGGVRKQNGHWQSSNMVVVPVDETIWEIRGGKSISDYFQVSLDGGLEPGDLTYSSGDVDLSNNAVRMYANMVAGRKYKLTISLNMSQSGRDYNQEVYPYFPWGRGVYSDNTENVMPRLITNNRLVRTYDTQTGDTLFTIDNYSGSNICITSDNLSIYGCHGYKNLYDEDTEPWTNSFTCEIEFTCNKTDRYLHTTGITSIAAGEGMLNIDLFSGDRATATVSLDYSFDYKLSRIS